MVRIVVARDYEDFSVAVLGHCGAMGYTLKNFGAKGSGQNDDGNTASDTVNIGYLRVCQSLHSFLGAAFDSSITIDSP